MSQDPHPSGTAALGLRHCCARCFDDGFWRAVAAEAVRPDLIDLGLFLCPGALPSEIDAAFEAGLRERLRARLLS